MSKYSVVIGGRNLKAFSPQTTKVTLVSGTLEKVLDEHDIKEKGGEVTSDQIIIPPAAHGFATDGSQNVTFITINVPDRGDRVTSSITSTLSFIFQNSEGLFLRFRNQDVLLVSEVQNIPFSITGTLFLRYNGTDHLLASVRHSTANLDNALPTVGTLLAQGGTLILRTLQGDVIVGDVVMGAPSAISSANVVIKKNEISIPLFDIGKSSYSLDSLVLNTDVPLVPKSEGWGPPLDEHYLNYEDVGEVPPPHDPEAEWEVVLGSGTESDPYQIQSAFQLNHIGTDSSLWDKHFIVTHDIDMNLLTEPFNRIGQETLSLGSGQYDFSLNFIGHFNGNNRVISNLEVDGVSTDYMGMFGSIFEANLTNIILDNVSVRGKNFVGGLVGRVNDSCTIENCHINGEIEGRSILGLLAGQVIRHPSMSSAGHSVLYDCTVSGQAFGTGNSVGGLVGLVLQTLNISECASSALVSSDGNNVGGLLGTLSGVSGKIHSCKSSGDVHGQDHVGGLIGQISSIDHIVTAENCYATGNVVGESRLGGLIGTHTGHVHFCVATGNVSSTTPEDSSNRYLGGLVGYLTTGSIKDSYALGDVFGNRDIGGIVGVVNTYTEFVLNRTPPPRRLERCFSFGKISGLAASVGGVLSNTTLPEGDGHSTGALYVEDCYHNNGQWVVGSGAPYTESHTNEHGIGLSFLEMTSQDEQVFQGFNFLTVWEMTGSGLPRLRNEDGTTPHKLYPTPTNGEGTEMSPIELTTYAQLNHLGRDYTLWDKHYVLLNHITANTEEPFNLIGSLDSPFTGTFDGGGYSVYSLVLSNIGNPFTGMFRVSNGGGFRDIHLRDVNVAGHDRVGGLVGLLLNGVVDRCSVTGNVTPTHQMVGGLVGRAEDSVVKSCFSDISLPEDISSSYVGGIVGYTLDTHVSDIYSLGNIRSSGASLGGLVGSLNGGSLTTSFSTSEVVYFQQGAGFAVIIGGPLVGGPPEDSDPEYGEEGDLVLGDIYYSYYNSDNDMSTLDNTHGEPLTFLQMTSQDVQMFQGFDFSDGWKMTGSGFPKLIWED